MRISHSGRGERQIENTWRSGNMKNKWQKALTCCTSTRKRSGDVPYVVVPDPIQKDGTSAVILDTETDTVSMPMWYWRKIVNYIIDTQAALKIAGAEKQK